MRKVLLGTFALAALTVLALSSVTDNPAEAARAAGKGGGKPGGTSATMSVSPNPAPVGITAVTVSGTGFKAGEGLNVGLPGIVPSYSIVTDSNGAFSFVYTMAGSQPFTAGEYTFQALRWKNGWTILGATATLIVR